MEVKITISEGCPYCQNAIKWLNSNNVPYEKTVLNTRAERLPFYALHNVSSVPQIFVDDVRIGGYSELMKSDFRTEVENGTISFDK